jgi:hypothetical protein
MISDRKCQCTVTVFEQDFALEDAIGSHACSLEAITCVTNGLFLLGCHYLNVSSFLRPRNTEGTGTGCFQYPNHELCHYINDVTQH